MNGGTDRRRAALDALAALDVCLECGGPAEHQHHVVPRSRGGTATVPLCSGCHGGAHHQTQVGLGLERKRLRCFAGEIDRTAAGIDYGYRPTASGGVEKDIGGEWEILERIKALHDDGFSPRAVVKKLGEDSIEARNGGPFNPRFVAQLLRKSGRACVSVAEGSKRGLRPTTLKAREIVVDLRAQGKTLGQIGDVLRYRFPGSKWPDSRVSELIAPPRERRRNVRWQREPNRRPDGHVRAEIAVRALRSEGLSVSRIAGLLRATSIRPALGGEWTEKVVDGLLRKKLPTDVIVGADTPERMFVGSSLALL